MTPDQIMRVDDAVRVEKAHASIAKSEGLGSRCRCGYCVDARDIIAEAAPDMLSFIREALEEES